MKNPFLKFKMSVCCTGFTFIGPILMWISNSTASKILKNIPCKANTASNPNNGWFPIFLTLFALKL